MFEIGSYVTFKSEYEFNDRFDLRSDEIVIKKNNKWNDIYKIVETQDRAVIVKLKKYPYLLKVNITRLKLASNTLLTSRRTYVTNNTPS